MNKSGLLHLSRHRTNQFLFEQIIRKIKNPYFYLKREKVKNVVKIPIKMHAATII